MAKAIVLTKDESKDTGKIWACFECGWRVFWSYDDLARRGTPVCPKCDNDMVKTEETAP